MPGTLFPASRLQIHGTTLPVSTDHTAGDKVPLDPLNTASTSFTWIDGGGASVEDFVSKEVDFKATIGGDDVTGKSTFHVKRPVVPITTTTTSTSIQPDKNGAQLIFSNLNLDPGISFTYTALPMIPSTFSGDTQWVQVVNSSSRIVTVNGKDLYNNSFHGLDGCYPYDFRNQKTDDSPVLGGLPSLSRLDTGIATTDDTYTMWLMFKPDLSNGVWVPIKKVDWYWNAEGDWTGIKWVVNTTNTHNASNPTFVDTLDFPRWSTLVSTSDLCRS